MTAEQQLVKGVGGQCQEFLSGCISGCTAEGHVLSLDLWNVSNATVIWGTCIIFVGTFCVSVGRVSEGKQETWVGGGGDDKKVVWLVRI